MLVALNIACGRRDLTQPFQGKEGRAWVRSPPYDISLFPQKGVGLVQSPNLSKIFFLLVIHREQGANFSSFPWPAFGE